VRSRQGNRQPDARRSIGTTATLIFAVTLSVYVATAGGSLTSTDAVVTYNLTESLVERGSIAVLTDGTGSAPGTDGRLYVADAWNQRVQVFEETTQDHYAAVLEWPIDGWFGQSLENKPYINAGPPGQICTTDPESYRVLCFSGEGEFILGWGEFGQEGTQFSLPVGIAVDDACRAWIADSAAGRLMRFTLPGCE